MRVFVAMFVAAVGATKTETFLQMGLRTKRVKDSAIKAVKKGDDDDDFVYGEDGFSDDAMDSSTLGVHEFIEAEDDSQIDEEDAEDPDLARTSANDAQTNFGEDSAEGQHIYDDEDMAEEYGDDADEEEE